MSHFAEMPVSRWSLGLVVRAGVVALIAVGVGGALGYAVSHQRSPSSPSRVVRPQPAGDAERALLAPLAVGSTVAGFEVRAIEAVRDGALTLTCAHGEATLQIQIRLRSAEAPAVAGRYGVFFSLGGGGGGGGAGASTEADGQRLARAVAEILTQHLDLPVPSGLTERHPGRE